MAAIFKLGTVTTVTSLLSIPELNEEPTVLFSLDDDRVLYAVPGDIYEESSFRPNDKVSFVIDDPQSLDVDIMGNGSPIEILTSVTFIKKYKEVRKRCRHV